MPSEKFVYSLRDGDGSNRLLLGGKGANLCTMAQSGLPIPAGFVITTEVCRKYMSNPSIMDTIWDDVKASVAQLEKDTGIPVVLMDANDIDQNQLGKCDDFPLTDE